MSITAALLISVLADTQTQLAVGSLYVTLVALVLLFVRRLELGLYPLVLLLTAVRIEPAPVDFMVLGLLGALAMRGDLLRFHPPRLVIVGGLLMLAANLLALIISPASAASMRFAVGTLLVLATGYVTFQLAAGGARIAERAWLIAAGLLAAEVVAAFLPIRAADVFHGSQVPRVQGLFKDPNVFGPFAVPAVLLLVVDWRRLPIALRAAGFALALTPIAAALSRGALVILVVSLIVLIATAAPARWRPMMLAVLLVLGLVVVAILVVLTLPGSPLGAQRGLTTRPLLFYDLSIRVAGQLAGWSYLAAHPFSMGVGPGNYEFALHQPSHETYLRMLVETGPISLIALFVFFWSALRSIRLSSASSLAWVSALVGFAIAGFFIDTLHWRQLWVMLAMPLAIAVQRDVQARSGSTPTMTAPGV